MKNVAERNYLLMRAAEIAVLSNEGETHAEAGS
jgi:hypothetical protein